MTLETERFEEPDTKTLILQRKDLNAVLEKKSPALIVLRGSETGLRISIKKDRVTLGRTVDADIVLNDSRVSRRHAEIRWDNEAGGYVVEDLGSTNGTGVNNRVISSCLLEDGDKIFVGGTILRFALQDEVDSQSSDLFDQLMFQDDLTGLVVRRRFDNDLRVLLQSARVQGESVALLMMDMDGLKKVNDSHGHPVGAFVISEVGKTIGAICNTRGAACRYGGDEFIAYIVGADRNAGIEVGEQIRDAIRSTVHRKDGVELRVSISIGVAVYPGDAQTPEDLTRAADEALYRAKERGRDAVSI